MRLRRPVDGVSSAILAPLHPCVYSSAPQAADDSIAHGSWALGVGSYRLAATMIVTVATLLSFTESETLKVSGPVRGTSASAVLHLAAPGRSSCRSTARDEM